MGSWTARPRRATGRYCVIGDSSKPWPCCSSAAGRKREPFSMSLMRWGRFHWRLRLSCARGLCCWRSRKATQHAHQLNQRERSERPQKWAGRRFQSTRPWRASTSPKFGSDEARRAARSRIGLRPINCSRGSGHFRAIGTALLLTPIEAFSAARLNQGVRATNHDPAPVFIVGMPRSGTTLVEQILAAHRDVLGAGERKALGDVFAALGGLHEDASLLRRIGTRLLTAWPISTWPSFTHLHRALSASLTRCRAIFSISVSSASCCLRAHHPLRPRSARHRAFDLYLPFPRRAWIRA